ncbi:hypothetical protein NL108_011526 [Boleophthalmus pectinirostris]|uniref:(E2-independent) E3 ubiquitin-conjugating enzyme FATS n=1 Tax=Boleophthalmus pectinirostris TaxID=150288 RepID=UPI00242AE21A|nr:(E2-independent) E3 ubiquitin-conjugating enzyme FATS [Boleophthalmus pectinirostris]KAJ0060437.1 hypothetical protein NL108_011526 [Boleophthalmus pectinirostris]
MSLRAPPAPLRKTWSRSGDESYWESPTRDPSSAPRPERRSRPQSATEGGQFDGWFKHLQRVQQSSNQDQAGQFGDTFRDREAGFPTWKAKGGVSSSWGSSSGGTSLCGSSFGSQESVQSGIPSPPERRDSWEKARISQTPKKEQGRVSFLTPVKIGWLPIKRKVTMVGEQGRNSDTAGQQVKLKPPITPTLVTNAPPSVKNCSDEEERRSQCEASAGGRTSSWQQQDSTTDKQVPEKRNPAVTVGDAPVSWQALKRSWRLNRVLALPGSSPSTKNQPRTNLDPPASKTFTQTSNVPQDKPELLHRTTFADPSRDSVTFKTPLQRTSSVQPLKASHIDTASTTKTVIPENKAGFSSITISSRKVCRSSSLPPTPSANQESMDSRRIMVQRKATIVKVTEQRVTTSPIHSVKPGLNQTASQNLDTVVHRRKATIIKVTEHRETYTPNDSSRTKEHRHSYTEGLYNENRTWTQENHTIPSSNPVDSKPIHKSTLNLMIMPPPATVAPTANSEITNVTPKRPQRPSSCYGNVFGNSEGADDKKVQPLTRKLSFDSSQRNGFGNLAKANGVKTSGQSKNTDGEMVVPPLTLIKAPDADQTPEDVLALNAAAIIANIKLQRQFSKKKTPNGKSENHSAPSPQENSETDAQDSVKDDSSTNKSHAAAFVPLSNDIQRPAQNVSLQEALLRSRPDFVARSRRRTEELERRAQERRDQLRRGAQAKRRGSAHSRQPQSNSCPGINAKDHSLKSSNRNVTKRQQPPSKRPSEVKRRQQQQQEEVKREAGLNRQRAELFKKKLLDQVLQRSKD